MTGAVIRKYDELVRCTNVLTEGIEHEFLKFVAHQEKCRKKWQLIEEESYEAKKFMAKYKAEQDTLEVKLKMARHQLDLEIKKRLKAEQSVDHMARQLELIKELLLDKDTDKQMLAQSIYKYDKTVLTIPENSIHMSYTVDSSIELSDSQYDMSENDILDETAACSPGRKGKRGRPSAPPLQVPTSTDETSEDGDNAKRTRVSEEDSTGYAKTTRFSEEVRRHSYKRESRYSSSQSKYASSERHIAQEEEPPRRSLTHRRTAEFINSSSNLSESCETDDADDKEIPVSSEPEEKKPASASNLYPNLDELGTPPKPPKPEKKSTPSSLSQSSSHSFVTKIAVRMETCGPCHKKLRFGSNVMKCKECKAVCHPECKDNLTNPCYPTKDTPGKKEGAVDSYVESKASRQVPDLILHCIEEIENRGLNVQGLYRIPGSDKHIKELKEKFLRKKNPDLRKVDDIHVICGCVKDFLRGLSEPLVTFSLHESFVTAAITSNSDERTNAMYQCISELPAANRETMASIIVHLQEVASSPNTQMNISNLSKIFGPTLVGHRSSNPTHKEMLEDTKHQKEVVACLLEISNEFWNQCLGRSAPSQSVKTPATAKSPPYNPNFQTPTTPELKQPIETLLGTTDPSSQSRRPKKQYNAMTPKVVSKDGRRQRHFFNSPS